MKVFSKIKCDSGCRKIYFLGIKIFSYKKKKHKYNQNKYMSRFPNTNIDATAFIDSNCTVGEWTFIGKGCDITKTEIGRYCSIAPHVRVGQGEHQLSEISTNSILTTKGGYEELTKLPCTIKNDVWIGTESVIRRGVVIGNGAVVAANSFVNKDVPDFAVVAGSPAKIIKMRFPEQTIKKILASKYWECPPEKARKILKELHKKLLPAE